MNHDPDLVRTEVRRRYGSIATADDQRRAGGSCCGGASSAAGCCGPDRQALALGYGEADLASVPEGANLGLGCGNPVALASLKFGQTVLDLGSGAGFDAFLAARAVGPSGKVIGVDMTPEMVAKARANAKRGDFKQVEFRLGEIEALPVADGIVDVILSNCVINLSPDKRAVYREAFRVLKPGGRLSVSDVVARTALPDEVTADLELHSSCLSGATPREDLIRILEDCGFADIDIRPRGNSDAIVASWTDSGIDSLVFSAEVVARKPECR